MKKGYSLGSIRIPGGDVRDPGEPATGGDVGIGFEEWVSADDGNGCKPERGADQDLTVVSEVWFASARTGSDAARPCGAARILYPGLACTVWGVGGEMRLGIGGVAGGVQGHGSALYSGDDVGS